MEEKAEKKHGRKLGRKIALGVLLGLVLLIGAGYAALCIYVGRTDTILPGVSIGSVPLDGLTQAQAVERVHEWAQQRYSDVSYTLTCGDSSAKIDSRVIRINAEEVARRAFLVGREESFLKRGAEIIAHYAGERTELDWELELRQPDGQDQLDAALRQLSSRENTPLVETVWSVSDDEIVITRGTVGRTVDGSDVLRKIEEAAVSGRGALITLPLRTEEPTPIDLQGLHDRVYIAPADAYYELSDRTVKPHVVGVDFDVQQAQAEFDRLGEGESMRIELQKTVPELTQDRYRKLLYADLLGECTTNVGGSENRLNNVRVATNAIDGVVVMPGDVFSYNKTLGPRTEKNGYLPAPAYVGGKTVDEVGGGICQDSSTLYLACLYANLEIVERVNHMYAVGYIPDGLDATVSYNAIDYQFRNNTGFPLRISAQLKERELTIRIYGTNLAGTSVRMETMTLSTTPYEVVYQPDDSVPVGRTVVDTTPYTGRKVEAYRRVYAADGTLLSRTLESTNNYRKRNQVILYNPADAVRLGLAGQEPSTGD